MKQKYYEKRTLTDVSGLIPYSDAGNFVCLSKEAIQIIRNYLSQPALWRSSYVANVIDSDEYELPDNDQWEIIQSIVGDALYALREENIMPVCDINEGLKYLADKLCECGFGCGGGGGGGAGGAGTVDDPPATGTDDPSTETPPEDWEDWETWQTYKCNAATYVVSQILQSLSNLSVINLVGMTVVGLAPLLAPLILNPLPGDELIVLAGIIVTVWGLGEAITQVCYDLLNNAMDEAICAIYRATNSSAAQTNFAAEMDEQAVTQGVSTALRPFVTALFDVMANNVSFNRVFELQSDMVYPTGNCGECGEGCEPTLFSEQVGGADPGEITSVNGYWATFESHQTQSTHWVVLRFNHDVLTDQFCGPGVRIEELELNNFTPQSPAGYRLYNEESVIIYSSHTPPVVQNYYPIRYLMLKSSTPFTGSIRVSLCPDFVVDVGSYNGRANSFEDIPGRHTIVIRLNSIDGQSHCSEDLNLITVSDLIGHTPYNTGPGDNDNFFVYDDGPPQTEIWSGTIPPSNVCGNSVYMYSATAWSCDFTIGNICP